MSAKFAFIDAEKARYSGSDQHAVTDRRRTATRLERRTPSRQKLSGKEECE